MARRILLVLLFLVVAGIVAAALSLRALAKTAEEKRKEVSAELSKDFEKHRARIEADEARWANDPLLAPRDGGNAAAVFAQHVGWVPASAGLPAPAAPLSTEVLTLLTNSTDGGWPSLRDEAILSADVTWLGALSTAGHWDTDEALTSVPYDALQEPVPDTSALLAAAKVRLIQGLADGGVVAAGADVRELARLTLTNESLLSNMVGIGILKFERRAHEAAVEAGLDVTGWVPVPEADAARLKALLWAAPAMTSVVATDALAQHVPRVGQCAALREGLGIAQYLRPWLEPELTERYAALGQQLDGSACRLSRLRAAWAGTAKSAQLPVSARAFCVADPDSDACALGDAPLPLATFSRPYVGNTLIAIGTPDWFKPYDELTSP